MKEITDFFYGLFNTDNWPPRWYCGIWTEFHGWFYICSDLMIWSAYFAIPAIIYYYMLKASVPFRSIFWLFIIFIFLCGMTHLVDVLMFWWPAYRLNAFVRFLTGLASWATVFALIKVTPAVLALKSPEELEKKNKELEKKTTELNTRNEEMKLLTSQLLNQNKQLEDFTHITSHNLRSPAGNLTALLALYKEQENPEEKQNIFNMFETVVSNLNETLNDLIEVVQIKKDVKVERQDIYFESVLKKIQDILRGEIIRTGTVIQYDFSKAPVLHYPKTYLESIILNLLTNAIKYRSPDRKPVIEIESFKEDNGVRLIVKDNGIGIDMKAHGHKLFGLYKTFHHNPDAKGLGLFITKSQVEALGGEISAESAVNKGMVMSIKFNQ